MLTFDEQDAIHSERQHRPITKTVALAMIWTKVIGSVNENNENECYRCGKC